MGEKDRENGNDKVKIYDKDMYISQEKLKTIAIIIAIFIIGFIAGYFSNNFMGNNTSDNSDYSNNSQV